MSQVIEQFTQKSPIQRYLTFVVLAVSLGLVTAAERDVQRRPADQMHGSKPLWRFVCLNALGAIGYLWWGRRPAGP
jgi:hypothetical protein